MGLGFKGILNSAPVIVGSLIMSNLIGAILFMLAENQPWEESFYWAWVTSMSIGYGDISPVTTGGRLVAILLGAFVLYVITPLVVGKFVMSAIHDSNAFDHAEQEQVKHDTHVTHDTVLLIEGQLSDTLITLRKIETRLGKLK